MQFNLKDYQLLKTKQYLKKNDFLLLSVGANQKAQNWISTEQVLYQLKLNYYKIYNNITIKIIKNSIYKNSLNIINSTFFFFKPVTNELLNKKRLLQSLNLIQLNVLAIKLNKKIYTLSQSKNIKSFNYKTNISVMYQFLITNLKSSYTMIKNKETFSKQCDLNT